MTSAKNLVNLWVLLCVLAFAVSGQSEEDLVDISAIPMFPQNYDHKIYAGYLNITNYAKSIYYVFF